jgi:ABC-type phosphate/phosphonate transport system ATPase subunit
MIELLGIGLPRQRGEWLFRRLSARLERGELTILVCPDREARLALLDAVVGRRIPTEGRVWVGGLPVSRETARRVHSRVGDVDLSGALSHRRSLLWNVLVAGRQPPGALMAAVRLVSGTSRARALDALRRVGLEGRAHERVADLDLWGRRRALVARAMVGQPEHVVVRGLDGGLTLPEAGDVLGVLRQVARSDRLTVLTSVADRALVHLYADRVLFLAAGALKFDGSPDRLTDDRAADTGLYRTPVSA